MPRVDILLHTGDLTNFGEVKSLRKSIKMLGSIEAELKLVIAGSHDISLNATSRIENMSNEEYTNTMRRLSIS
jgi:3',5'-cyclic AMP phosphodiesterase CpdA